MLQVSVNGFIWKQHTQKPTFLKTNKEKEKIHKHKQSKFKKGEGN